MISRDCKYTLECTRESLQARPQGRTQAGRAGSSRFAATLSEGEMMR